MDRIALSKINSIYDKARTCGCRTFANGLNKIRFALNLIISNQMRGLIGFFSNFFVIPNFIITNSAEVIYKHVFKNHRVLIYLTTFFSS